MVDSYSIDESVYGVRGMAGNVVDWTSSRGDSNPLNNQRVPLGNIELRDDITSDENRVLRGGAWSVNKNSIRISYRNKHISTIRLYFLGFRLARSYPLS